MKKAVVYLLFLSVILLIACSPITRSSGEIVDVKGQPVENVSIKINGKSVKPSSNLEYLTKSDGRYNFEEIKVSAELPTEIKLTAAKSGYKTVTKDLKFGEDNVDKITLEAEAK